MMDTNTSLLFEMRMLNELRKLKPEQRKELYETLEREERLEEEALKKNPNLHVETKLAQVLGEIKDQLEGHIESFIKFHFKSSTSISIPSLENNLNKDSPKKKGSRIKNN